MENNEQTNKVKILKELQKNGRASLSELAVRTGLTRQTVAKTIKNMEKKKEIWGYTTIFDPKIIDKKPYILLGKLNLSLETDNFLKKVLTNVKIINENEEKFGLKISMFLHGTSDFLALFWGKDVIEAKKIANFYKKSLHPNIQEIEIIDVIATFRNCGIANPNMINEWKNLLL